MSYFKWEAVVLESWLYLVEYVIVMVHPARQALARVSSLCFCGSWLVVIIPSQGYT
jgi:hypothetical protein